MNIEQVPLSELRPDPDDPRRSTTVAEDEELLASVRLHGVKVPCIAYRGKEHKILLDGHRRFHAATGVGLTTLPTIVLEKAPDAAELLLTQLIINCQRQDWSIVDQYESHSKLMKLKGWSATELATNLGIHDSKVSRILALGKLSPEERQFVRERGIAASSACAISRLPADQRSQALEEAASGEATRDALHVRARQKPTTEDAVKTSRICCRLAGGTITVSAGDGLDLARLVELLEELLRECRKARTQGLDISTAVRVLRDRARTA